VVLGFELCLSLARQAHYLLSHLIAYFLLLFFEVVIISCGIVQLSSGIVHMLTAHVLHHGTPKCSYTRPTRLPSAKDVASACRTLHCILQSFI
jgi:hypothetical protein